MLYEAFQFPEIFSEPPTSNHKKKNLDGLNYKNSNELNSTQKIEICIEIEPIKYFSSLI